MSFIGLFSELDHQPSLGIVNYGVSMTTLEDVFLRLEAEAEVDQAGECVNKAGSRSVTLRKKKPKLLCVMSDVRLQCVQSGASGG